jgi:ABC-type spermidine/putrescine transport system permease subunit II
MSVVTDSAQFPHPSWLTVRVRVWREAVLLWPWALLLGFLIAYPIGILLLGSFSLESPRAWRFALENFTLENYARLIGSAGFRAALLTSVEAAAVGAVLAVLIGLLFALVVAKTDFHAK